ncbi:hypothetical protein RHGRI_028930 [Rhododendron griersonianum]|uniref:RNA polymerase II transcription factor B subunit 2 n=1 Tax=Rhododendron griersonianum TaxID=479676 RepID=A0AAV6IID9_9ERIC|nr:hypothetical protein RHGRI_028930 [Rhododendron griersonianum]
MPQVKIIAKNFMDMVASLPAMKLDKLYDNAFICEAPFSDTNGLPLNSIRSGVLPREPMPSTITVRLPSLEDLEAYAAEQWELRPSGKDNKLQLFNDENIPTRPSESELMDTNAQLWYIIREYITNSEERGVDTADLISFLLELSFHVTGEAYNMNTLTDIQRNVIKDLADLGLVKLQQGRKESWFIPTKLATNLSISLSDLSSRKQIITFLQQNAHPRVAERIPSVPENVTDQIRLWESDMNRVEMTPASLFDEFPSRDVFEAACDFAREYGGVLWEDSKKMRLVVKAEILGQIREFLRR